MYKSKILGLRTTIYKVGDIENAKKWYANVFKTEPYFDQPFYVGLVSVVMNSDFNPKRPHRLTKQKAL